MNNSYISRVPRKRYGGSTRRNPYEKFLCKEDHLQIQVCQYLYSQYPDVLFHHSPNENKRTKFEQYKMKRMGCKAGTPDVMIYKSVYISPNGNGMYNGLAIELKIHPNKTTAKQEEWLKALELNGWKVAVCFTFEEAREVIDNYLVVKYESIFDGEVE